MLGMSLSTFTLLHVLISLIGVVAGLIAMVGWLKSDPSRIPTAIFLATMVLTSVTGFLFPFTKLLPMGSPYLRKTGNEASERTTFTRRRQEGLEVDGT